MKILAARSLSEAEQFDLEKKAYFLYYSAKKENKSASEILSSSSMPTPIDIFQELLNLQAEATELFLLKLLLNSRRFSYLGCFLSDRMKK